MSCTWVEVYRLTEEMIGVSINEMLKTFMDTIFTNGWLQHLQYPKVLNAKTSVIYALLTDKNVSAYGWINSKDKNIKQMCTNEQHKKSHKKDG